MQTIKRITLFLSVALLLNACNEDESTPIDTNAEKNDLIGTWNLTEVTQDGKGTVTYQSIPVSGNVDAFGKNINAQITLTENPDNLAATGGYTAEITASVPIPGIQPRTEDLPIVLNDVLSQSSWSLDNGVITLTNGVGILAINITELSTNTLKIEFDYDDEISFQDFLDGAPIALDTKVNMSFTKQ